MIYLVKPLPQSLLNYVFNFDSSLNEDDEKQYTIYNGFVPPLYFALSRILKYSVNNFKHNCSLSKKNFRIFIFYYLIKLKI